MTGQSNNTRKAIKFGQIPENDPVSNEPIQNRDSLFGFLAWHCLRGAEVATGKLKINYLERLIPQPGSLTVFSNFLKIYEFHQKFQMFCTLISAYKTVSDKKLRWCYALRQLHRIQ